MLDYRIDVTRPASRELAVTVRLILSDRPESTGSVDFFLPTWTPGSYLIREFSRHISRVIARDAATGEPLAISKTSKNRWRLSCSGVRQVELQYRVYAHELSVRTADVDSTHAFWNHACVLLWPANMVELPCTISVAHPPGWTSACSLPRTEVSEQLRRDGTFELRASNFEEAIDAPVLLGELTRLEWQVGGVPHAIVLDGLGAVAPPTSLVADLTRIVESAAAVFGGELPYRSYTFLSLFAAEGHGGLEHRDSSVLLMARTSLSSARGYREFLGLAAHELFHAWNVKRLRPKEFWSYDYEQENYTSLLWLMEGWTAYYDDLLVMRAGLMDADDYLAAMAKNVQGMFAAPGRKALSLAESSFDAWIRLYRPDENTRNSSQNYYGNGAVAAMCLDLVVRRTTSGLRSLDDVLRALWLHTWRAGRGYELRDVMSAIEQVAGNDAVAALTAMVEHDLEPDLQGLLATVGVHLQMRETTGPYLGVAFQQGSTVLASVNRDGPAFEGGLAPADELLALGDVRVTAGNWQAVFAAVTTIDQPVDVLLARRGLVTTLRVTPSANPGTANLVMDPDATPEALLARAAWLNIAVPVAASKD